MTAKKPKKKKSFWLLPFIAALLIIFSLFMPAFVIFNGDDLSFYIGGIIELGGNWSVVEDVIGDYSLVLISVSAAFLLLFSILAKVGLSEKHLRLKYGLPAIVIIIALILWLIDRSIMGIFDTINDVAFSLFIYVDFIVSVLVIIQAGIKGISEKKRARIIEEYLEEES